MAYDLRMLPCEINEQESTTATVGPQHVAFDAPGQQGRRVPRARAQEGRPKEKVHATLDALGHLPSVPAAPASTDGRAQIAQLMTKVQEANTS